MTPDRELAEALEHLDDAGNYAGWIYGLMEPHLGRRLLEVGAGHGTITELLAGTGRIVVSQDISERCVAVLRERFAGRPHVHVISESLEDITPDEPFDTAVLVNVLEHIEDDEKALRRLADLLLPGGRLVIWAPAFQALYSEFDRRIGHHRRYTRRSITGHLHAARFEVETARYVNPVGAMAWFVYARLLRRTPTHGRAVRVFDRYVVPVLQRLESRVRMPVGQSIFVVARKPEG